MTSSASTGQTPGIITADPQDPLPESNWAPRRWYAFLSLGLGFILALVSITNGGHGVGWIMAFLIAGGVFYMVAPSAEQAVKMLAAVSAMKGGVSFKTSSSVTTPEGGEASTTSSAEQAGKVASE